MALVLGRALPLTAAAVGGLGLAVFLADGSRVLNVNVHDLASLGLDLPECLAQDTFKFAYTDEATGEHRIRGQCNPAVSPGAFYTSDAAQEWQCWSPDFGESLRTDAEAKTQNFAGACLFAEFSAQHVDVESCRSFLAKNPVDCGPGPSVYWGACVPSDPTTQKWQCIGKDDPEIPNFVKGSCKAMQVREDAKGELYEDVCRFESRKQKTYKCDTLPSYSAADGATCGAAVSPVNFGGACFDVKAGEPWQCFEPKDLATHTPCDWTVNSAGQFYSGECVFPGSPGYEAAEAHPLARPTTPTKPKPTDDTTKTDAQSGAAPRAAGAAAAAVAGVVALVVAAP